MQNLDRGSLRLAFFATVVLGLGLKSASAGLIAAGTGVNSETGNTVSGQVEFSISGDVLTVVLTNTTAGGTLTQADVLMGLVFNVDAASLPALALASISLSDGSTIHIGTSTTDDTAPLGGSWTDQLADSAEVDFGVATTGFGELFEGGGISLGNASADYGLIAEGTSLATGFPKVPFVETSLTFTFSGAEGLTEADIRDVSLLFGGDGDTSIEAVVSENPEPGSLTLAALGAAIAAGGAARRRARLKRRPATKRSVL